MADYIPNPGRGTLFKQPDDKPAAWSGKIALPDGTLAYLDLYKATDRDTEKLKRDRDGNPYYNIRIKPIEGPRADQSAPAQDLDDDLPF